MYLHTSCALANTALRSSHQSYSKCKKYVENCVKIKHSTYTAIDFYLNLSREGGWFTWTSWEINLLHSQLFEQGKDILFQDLVSQLTIPNRLIIDIRKYYHRVRNNGYEQQLSGRLLWVGREDKQSIQASYLLLAKTNVRTWYAEEALPIA